MPIEDIIHVAIKTEDLEATNKFYTEILGAKFAQRPPMDIPGSWLDFNGTQIHVLAGEKAFTEENNVRYGTGTVDHIAVRATDFDSMKKTALDNGLDIRENDIKEAGLWQLFVKDPSGVVIEMNFWKQGEPDGADGPDPSNQYYFARF